MPNYYDDQKQLIATDTSELLTYFNSLRDTIAYEMPVTLPCAATAVLQIKSTGVIPKFLYVGSPVPKNKIYPQLLQSDTLDLSPLCNGVNNINLVPIPDCGTVVCSTFTLSAPDCGTIVFTSGYAQQVLFTPNSGGGWALYGDIGSTVDAFGVVTLNLSVINSGITTHTLFTVELLGSISLNGAPFLPVMYTSASHPNMPPSSQLDIASVGSVNYTGYETSLSSLGAVIEIYNIQYNTNH